MIFLSVFNRLTCGFSALKFHSFKVIKYNYILPQISPKVKSFQTSFSTKTTVFYHQSAQFSYQFNQKTAEQKLNRSIQYKRLQCSIQIRLPCRDIKLVTYVQLIVWIKSLYKQRKLKYILISMIERDHHLR